MKKIIMGVTLHQMTEDQQAEMFDMINSGEAVVKKLQTKKWGTIEYLVCH